MQKRVLVTGGASGLGRAIAHRWAKAGATICIADLNRERGEQVLQEIAELGSEAFYQHCDITKETDIQKLKQEVLAKWQGLDLLVNNAGVASAGALMQEDMEQWRWVMDINVMGSVAMTQAFYDVFREQKSGYLLNVASQAGLTAAPMMASYCASKAAMVSFSETMKLELLEDNIGVSVLCPAFFKTNLDESVRSGNPAMKGVVTKLLDRAKMTADQVADRAFEGVQTQEFMILTHKEGKRAWWVKRFFPKYYLKMMANHTKQLRKMGR